VFGVLWCPASADKIVTSVLEQLPLKIPKKRFVLVPKWAWSGSHLEMCKLTFS